MGGRKRREGGPALRPASAPGTQLRMPRNLDVAEVSRGSNKLGFAAVMVASASTVAGGQILTSNSKKMLRAGVLLTGPAP